MSEFQRCTVSSESPHRITNQWMGSLVTIPQTSHRYSCRVVIDFFRGLGPSGLLRRRGWSETWREYGQLADSLALYAAAKLRVIHHPQLWNNFADQLPMTEKPHYGTFRNYYAYGLGHGAHVGRGNVTAAQPQGHIHRGGYSVEVAACGKDNSGVTHHEAAIQLRQLLHRAAEVGIGDVARSFRVSR